MSEVWTPQQIERLLILLELIVNNLERIGRTLDGGNWREDEDTDA